MWSHYADSHKGFVLEFEADHCYFDRRKKDSQLGGHLKKVRYTKTRPEFVFFDHTISTNKNMNNWVKDFIWVKGANWDYEQEWRVIEGLDDSVNTIQANGQEIHLFSIPCDAIKSIYLGCKMSRDKQTEFVSLTENDKNLGHISIFQAISDEREYKLNFSQIR